MVFRSFRLVGRVCLVVLLVAQCGMAQQQAVLPGSSGGDTAVLYVPLPGSGSGVAVPGMNQLPQEAGAGDGVWQRNIASHAHLIAHRSNLSAAINNPSSPIRPTKWFTGQPSPAAAMTWLGQHLHATPVPGTALIEVSIDGDLPANEAAVIVNTIARTYLERDRIRGMDTVVEQIDLLQNLKLRYDTQAKSLRTEASNLAATLQLDGMGRPGFVGQKEQELQLLTVQRIKAMNEVTVAENALKQANEQVQTGTTPAIVEAQLGQDWEITSLRQNLTSLKVQISTLSAEGQDSKAVLSLKAAIESTQQKLDQRLAERRKTLNNEYLANLKAESDAKNVGVATITRQMDQLKSDLADLGARLSEYLTKHDEETSYRELSRRYADQLDRLNVMRQHIDMSRVVLIAPAEEAPK